MLKRDDLSKIFFKYKLILLIFQNNSIIKVVISFILNVF